VLRDEGREVSVASIEALARRMVETLEADSGRLELAFPFFVDKAAPVSGERGLIDYDVELTAEVKSGVASQTLKVVVPVTTLCPCSKEISEYGAHNQRGHITVTVESAGAVWIEEIIDLVEDKASCEVYGVLKRPDEKFVTERAYENPKFVEDVVRDVASALKSDARLARWVVEVENFESIHNHSAYAYIEGSNSTA
jgi:GTP cyclohydrolase I